MTSESSLPEARVITANKSASQRWSTRLWWLTAASAILAIALVASSFRTQGLEIHVRFQDGHGLKAGDTLHYRGIDVGTVTRVAVSSKMDGVDTAILLAPGNESLAVEGSQFWIERARLRLGQVSGLDTVLGAKYVGVLPGNSSNKRQRDFVGLESPLGMAESDAIEVRIQFPAGEGLEVGDPIRHRGIAVGEVTDVDLNESADAVQVRLRLVGAAKSFAKVGSQFWIERPRIDLTEIRGLETLLGGRYVAVQPNDADAEPATDFVGLAEPPPLPRRSGSLELELDAADRAGLVRGAPVTYRGLEVGRIANVGLSSDGATVRIQVVIDAEYADLVRENSKWWSIRGIQFDMGLKGVNVSIDSLASWLRGGVAFATPEEPGAKVVTGYRFTLLEQPEREWLSWQPRIAVGNSASVEGRPLPKPTRVAVTWKASWLGLYRRHSEQSWGIALDDGRLLVPTRLVRAANAAGKNVTIEVAGTSLPFVAGQVVQQGEVSLIPIPNSITLERWPTSEINTTWSGKEVMLVVNQELNEPIAIDASRVAKNDSRGLHLISSIPISEALEGSAVTDAQTGRLVGLLTRPEKTWIIAKANVSTAQ